MPSHTNMNTGTASLTFSLLALAPLLPAQQSDKDKSAPPTNKQPFTLDVGNAKLVDLIDRCAAYLDCNILYQPIEFAGAGPASTSIAVAQAVSTDRAGCLELLARSLQGAGFALTWSDKQTGRLEVIFHLGPRSREIMARAEFETEQQVAAAPNLCMPVMVHVPLQHINAVVAANQLRPTLMANREPGKSVTVGNVGVVPGLVLAGMRPEVAKVIRMIREIDQPNPDSPTDRSKRLAALEKRIAALEAQLAAPPAGSTEKPK